MTRPNGSEYGGRPGVIQPPPHDYHDSASEQLTLAVRTDAADPASDVDAQYRAEQRENARRPT